MKKLAVIKQFIYNVVATALPTIVLQLVVLPFIALKMEGDIYGLLLTIVAVVMMVAAGCGNVLNNVQMLSNNEYEEKKVVGDYGIIFSGSLLVLSVITIGTSYFYGIASVTEHLLILVLAITMFAKEYYIVRFWIDLDYLGILKCNAFCVFGYIIGMLIYWVGGNWQYIYILGNVFGLTYIVKVYGIPAHFMTRTILFGKTLKKFFALTVATILTRSLQYVDRLLLYPLLGGEKVTIYYVSTLIGKTISIALGPINSFLLSQLAKKNTIGKKIFWQILGITFGMGAVAYFCCLIISRPILGILYAQWVDQSMIYVKVTTLTAVISAMSMVISPIVLKFCNMNWQIVISGACFVVYVVASLTLLNFYDLMGFCIGGMLANLVSLCLMIVIFLFSYQKGEKE